MSTPTPRTNRAWNTLGDENAEAAWSFARTLERELHESRNAERLARVQLGNERARLDDLISVNATGAARLAHATAQLATEREKVRALRLACERLRDCDWVISLPDRMDAVRDIARAALAATEDTP
jgi:hypothetical protein